MEKEEIGFFSLPVACVCMRAVIVTLRRVLCFSTDMIVNGLYVCVYYTQIESGNELQISSPKFVVRFTYNSSVGALNGHVVSFQHFFFLPFTEQREKKPPEMICIALVDYVSGALL